MREEQKHRGRKKKIEKHHLQKNPEVVKKKNVKMIVLKRNALFIYF